MKIFIRCNKNVKPFEVRRSVGIDLYLCVAYLIFSAWTAEMTGIIYKKLIAMLSARQAGTRGAFKSRGNNKSRDVTPKNENQPTCLSVSSMTL